MFSSFFTIPADGSERSKKQPSSGKSTRVRTALTWVFLIVYLSLMVFALVSAINPVWMQKLAKTGIESESTSYKHFGDTFLLQKHDYRQAIAQYRKSLEIKPDNVGALVNMGIAYMRLGDEKTGLKAFSQALKLDNVRKGVIYYNLAEQLEKNGKTDEALKYFEMTLGNDVDPVMVYRSLGRVYLSMGENEKAREAFQNALNTELDVTYQYRRMLQRTAAVSADDTIHFPVLEAALSEKISEETMQQYDLESIYNIKNGNKDISLDYYNLGLAYQNMADSSKAYQSFQQSLNVWPGNLQSGNALRALTQK